MIPVDWTEYRRADDDELLGYLRASAGGVEAVTLFGYPIGEAATSIDAERYLDALGLSYLSERWMLTLDGRTEPVTVQLVEATPALLTLKSVDYGFEGDYGTAFTLEVPVDTARLRPERPLR